MAHNREQQPLNFALNIKDASEDANAIARRHSVT